MPRSRARRAGVDVRFEFQICGAAHDDLVFLTDADAEVLRIRADGHIIATREETPNCHGCFPHDPNDPMGWGKPCETCGGSGKHHTNERRPRAIVKDPEFVLRLRGDEGRVALNHVLRAELSTGEARAQAVADLVALDKKRDASIARLLVVAADMAAHPEMSDAEVLAALSPVVAMQLIPIRDAVVNAV